MWASSCTTIMRSNSSGTSLEQARHADLAFGLEFAALHPRDGRVGAERVPDHVELVVERDLGQRLGIAQELRS